MVEENNDQKSSASAVRESLQNKKLSLLFSKISPKKILLSLGIFAIPVGIGVCFIQVPIGCACGNPAISKAGGFLRYQEWYFIENQKFNSSTERVRGLTESGKRYQYSVEVEQDRAFSMAHPMWYSMISLN